MEGHCGQSQKLVHVKEEFETDSGNLHSFGEASALVVSFKDNAELQYVGCLTAVHVKEEDFANESKAPSCSYSAVSKAVLSHLYHHEVKDENVPSYTACLNNAESGTAAMLTGLYTNKVKNEDMLKPMPSQTTLFPDSVNCEVSEAAMSTECNLEVKNEVMPVFLPSQTPLCSNGTDIVKDEVPPESMPLQALSRDSVERRVSGAMGTGLCNYEIKNEVMSEYMPSQDITDGVSEAAMLAGLYNDHTVKDELVLGPEHPHRPDAILAVPSWVLTDWSASPLKKCSVRLKHQQHQAFTNNQGTKGSHTVKTPEVKQNLTHERKGRGKRESVCSLCGEAFGLKSDLMRHVLRHIHMPTRKGQERNSASDCEKSKPSMRDCWVRLERGVMIHRELETKKKYSSKQETVSRQDSVPRQETVSQQDSVPRQETVSQQDSLPRQETVSQQGTVSRQEMHSDAIQLTSTHTYACDTCDETFQNEKGLISHNRVHQRQVQILPNTKPELNHKRSTSKKAYVCEYCNKVLKCKRSVYRHELAHKGVKPYCCKICKKTFARADYIKHHTRTAHSIDEKTCDICQKKYKHSHGLKTHKLLIHSQTDRKSYPCENCGKHFVGLGNFKRHKQIHIAERKYQCEICNKKYTLKSTLDRHQLVHTGEKPYACEICKKPFSLLHALKVHKETHTGEKPYTCQICKKQFSQFIGLRSHRRLHEGIKRYICEICSKAFMHLSTLNKHKLIHIGVKKHRCEICDRRFLLLDTLKQHIKTHTGIKPFSCEICQRAFKTSHYLNIHKRIHTVHIKEQTDDIQQSDCQMETQCADQIKEESSCSDNEECSTSKAVMPASLYTNHKPLCSDTAGYGVSEAEKLTDEVKEEALCSDGMTGMSESAMLAGVDTDHDVKDELVLGSEHVKEEPSLSESLEYGMSEAAMLADLYADHVVKDELVLGPEHPHRPDVSLVVLDWALAVTDGFLQEPRKHTSATHPALKDCCVRLERLHHEAPALHTIQDTTHTDSDPEDEMYTTVDCERVPEPVCDLCGKKFSLKSELLKHVMTHIHTSSMEQEGSGPVVADYVFEENPLQERVLSRDSPLALRNGCVLLEHLQHHEALAGNDTTHTAVSVPFAK
ncbi:zinc finger protein 62 homolog [Cydia amplana]|uniref:zinc finger protein 62 homolog n=1 Tax=Cydia amplana TaxID=1869771 RepID=UPI002FE68F62